ncbi:sensor histidine kinase [Croceivirga thetidis]|nr:sensor histidine kinase [Croceivirga thetidis]
MIETPQNWDENKLVEKFILTYSGKSLNIKNDNKIKGSKDDFIYYLIEGYQNVNDPSETKLIAYQNFSKAIKLADDLELKECLKFSLISMLELLKQEIFLDKEKYTPYLNHLKEVESDFTDALVIALFEVDLNSKEDSNLNYKAERIERLTKLDSLFARVPENNLWKAEYYYSKAIQAKLKSDFENSLIYMHKANSLFDKKFQRKKYATTFWQLSSIFYLKSELDSALIYLNESKKYSVGPRDNYYDERLASWIFNKSERFDSAYYYLDKSIKSEYKWDAKKNSLESSLLSIENETEKLKNDKLRLDNRRKTNQNYLIIAISLLVIGSITAVFLQKNTTKKRQLAEQEAVLKQQRVENLLKDQELVSIDAMIAGQEKERQKVAGELHDDLGSLMATIKLHFDNAKISRKDPALKNAQKLLDEAYQKIRGMAHSKNSGVMSDQGLLAAIQKMAKTITETNALEVSVEDFGLGERLENSLELSIFRMVQELVANAIKHAEATKVTIQLTQYEDNLNIIVEDNGKGFDRSKLNLAKSGMGLTNIEKRVEHLEGSFTVDSVMGKGTSILIDIPV